MTTPARRRGTDRQLTGTPQRPQRPLLLRRRSLLAVEGDGEFLVTKVHMTRTLMSALNSEATKMYLLRKQSSYSGKGTWLSLTETSTSGTMELEAGVYVASEKFVITKDNAAVASGAWNQFCMSYDGLTPTTTMNGEKVGDAVGDEHSFSRANTQPLKIGEDWAGLIDGVKIFSSVLGADSHDVHAHCPSNVLGITSR